MNRTIQVLLGTAAVTAAGMIGAVVAQPAWAAPERCQLTVSDGAEILVCAQLADSPGRPGYVYGHGRAIEQHEYLREIRVLTTVERKNATGGWDVIASAESWDREGVSVSTADRPNTGVLRSCATGGIRGHGMHTVCTA